MKQQEFINWINENGYSSIINVIGRDSKGDFLDITANRIYELFKINPNIPVQAVQAINEIIQLKVKLLNNIKKFNVGDNVIFRNVLTKLAGRISRVVENEHTVLGYEIKAIDSTFNISTYHVSCDSIINLVDSK